MCPGICVLGGGGGGGGGAGGGAGSGDGKQGAGGEGGADGAEGDGRGGDNCGLGAPPGCSNCGNTFTAGDPVDLTSGKVFTMPAQDLFLPGLFNLSIKRSYCTASRDRDVGLGPGWRFSLAWYVVERRSKLIVHTGDGRAIEFPKPEIGQQVVLGGWSVERGEEHYTVRAGNEFEHYFGRLAPGSNRFKLEFITHRNHGHVALQYEGELLVRAMDTVGRTILFHRANHGRITSIAVPDTHGNTLVFARYAYDDLGRLAGATDADGHTTYYRYDDRHLLTELEYPNGLVYRFVYDRQDRCIETWGAPRSGMPDPALAEGLDETLADGRTAAKGIQHCVIQYDEDYSECVDSLGLRRCFAGDNGIAAKTVNGRGGVTTRELDKDGRVVAKGDAVGNVWRYAYDGLDKLVKQTDPEGAVVQVRRDAAGREIAVVDPLGAETLIERDGSGDVIAVTNAVGGNTRFTRDHRGLPVEVVDPRGGRHRYEWDAHANLTSRTFSNGARYVYAHDYWGRTLSVTEPGGAETRFGYNHSGRPAWVADATGGTRHYRWSPLGKLAAETLPDGSTTELFYGGRGWLYCVRFPDGSEKRAGHNREGVPIWIQNERGERHEFKHDADGMIAWEKNFHGHEYAFERDLMGRMTAVEDSHGKRVFTLSATGRRLADEGPDGALREFAYDAKGQLLRAHQDGVGFSWDFDLLGRIVREELQVEGQRYEVASTLDGSGQRTAMKTSLGLELGVHRDVVGRVKELTEGRSPVLKIERDERSLPVRRELAQGGAVVERFDALKRLRRRQVLQPGSDEPSDEPEWIGTGAPGQIDRLFDYSPVGELVKETSADGDEIVYEYDVRRHLTKRERNGDAERYQVDNAGNYFPEGPDAPSRVYGQGNQLQQHGDIEFRYDDRGFLTEKRSPGADGAEDVTRFEYDGFGMLRRVVRPDESKVEFDYDPFARRLAKRVIENDRVVKRRHYVWDLLAMVHERAVGEADEVRTYLFEDRDRSTPMGHKESDGWRYYLRGIHGLPEEIVDGAGRSVGKLEHDAFGRTQLAAGSKSNTKFRFTGQFEDEETGLHYNRYRYFDPTLGRYITPDPVGLGGGMNLYEYGPNPVGWVDPMGWHGTTVTTTDQGFLDHAASQGQTDLRPGADPNSYTSGWPSADETETGATDVNRCNPNLRQEAWAHSEQKFCEDLIAYDNSRGGNSLGGNTYNLSGEWPPCNVCHAAMAGAAQQTGATITYSFPKSGGNSITYDGSSPMDSSMTFTGTDAQTLQTGGYNTVGTSGSRSGYSSGSGSAGTYSTLMDSSYR
jgi:RHS repeat-associated protein